jgi:hypothetical protein
MSMRTEAEALDRVRRDGALTLASLVAAVAGGPVRGSWWGHEKGGLIFRLASALEDSGEVLVAKLAGGKVTFLHRRLWPALLRLVTDAGWRRRRAAGLPAEARSLWRRVERAGELGFASLGPDERRRLAPARQELDARLLVLASSEHTASGTHLPVLRSWKRWSFEAGVAAAPMTLEVAAAALAAVGVVPSDPAGPRRQLHDR